MSTLAYMAPALLLDGSLEDSITFTCVYQAVHILTRGLFACHNVYAPLHHLPAWCLCAVEYAQLQSEVCVLAMIAAYAQRCLLSWKVTGDLVHSHK